MKNIYKLAGMSKHSKSRLTGSRRKRVRPSRPQRAPRRNKPDWLDAFDAMTEPCARIETLAGLLYACGDPMAMDARLASRAAYFIEKEMGQVKKLLAELAKRMRTVQPRT